MRCCALPAWLRKWSATGGGHATRSTDRIPYVTYSFSVCLGSNRVLYCFIVLRWLIGARWPQACAPTSGG